MARKPKEPLLAALDAADAAIHGDGTPADRLTRALVSLADGLAAILAESDGRTSTMRKGTGAKQVLDRYRDSQIKSIADIRALAEEATRGISAGISRRARTATRNTVRSEVKKRRIRRSTANDVPGGEG